MTQGEGINQTTISPSDALKIPINFDASDKPLGNPVEAKLKGGKTGNIGVHLNPDKGNVHIQPLGGGNTHLNGVLIDPAKPIAKQIKTLVTGPKSAINKIENQIKKGLEQLKELKEN
jgi:hypothetical protein